MSPRGFIQIPVFVAWLILAAFGGGAYVVYEAAKPSGNFTATTEDQNKATTTSETSASVDSANTNKQAEIDVLKKQVQELTAQTPQPKTEEKPVTSVIALPSGTVVEMDASGNIIRTIVEAPQTYNLPTYSPPVDDANQKQHQIDSIVAECNLKINVINQQIIDLKEAYYKKVAVIEKQPIPIGNINGQKNKLLNETNTEIEKLNLQIWQIELDCQNKLYQL